jgi:hypothetical protein
VMCVICVLCLIVVPLPQGKNPFAVEVNKQINYFSDPMRVSLRPQNKI